MAKRGRRPKGTISTIASELEWLDSRRRALINQLRIATQRLVSSDEGFSIPLRRSGGVGVGNGRKRRGKGGRRKGFKMSKAARAKISAAQKARWAKQKKAG